MKLTKKILNENKICNPYDLSEATGKNPFISFTPKESGRAYHPAKWQVIRIDYRTDPKAGWLDQYNKTFTIYRKDEKEPLLIEAKAWVKQRYGLDITERDVWGNWHVTGTMAKLEEIIKANENAKLFGWDTAIQELGNLDKGEK
jgi:hypothetical protein